MSRVLRMGMMERLVAKRHRRWARELMLLYGLEIHPETKVGEGVTFMHRGLGTVFHPRCVIEDHATIYHQVTLGAADGHDPHAESGMGRIEIGSRAVLYPGSKVLGGPGVTRVGEGTILAANAVLTQSTGDWEVWGGIPARKLADRPNRRGSDTEGEVDVAVAGVRTADAEHH